MLIPKGVFQSKDIPSRPLSVVICGSTGSIGQSALQVIEQYPNLFNVFALCARSNAALLQKQIELCKPRYAVLENPNNLKLLNPCPGTELLWGDQSVSELVSHTEVDVVLAAVVGSAGLPGVLSALEAGKKVALANKESLVAAGPLVAEAVSRSGAQLIPVDSEHSAVFQLLQAAASPEIRALTLTASGGPFLRTPIEEFRKITPADAIKHPKWSMGAKISVDSATLMNKALEVIEARWLFGFSEDVIEVLVHPQSIVHALITLSDGTQLAHLSNPDMQGPIAYALGFPYLRLPKLMSPLKLEETHILEFLPLDAVKFPAVDMAKQCLSTGGAACAVLNCANEVAVDLFLKGKISFDQIMHIVSGALDRWAGQSFASLEELMALEREVREGLRSEGVR